MGQARQNVITRRGQAYDGPLSWLGGERTHLAAKLLFSTFVILISHLPILRTCLVLGSWFASSAVWYCRSRPSEVVLMTMTPQSRKQSSQNSP
jgi:hypothetical protein